MKIVIISNSKKPSGGVERFSYYLMEGLLGRGYEVLLVGREDLGSFAQRVLSALRYTGLDQPLQAWLLGRVAVREGFDVCVTNGMLGWNIRNRKVLNVQHGTFVRGAIRTRRDDSFPKFFIKRYIWSWFEKKAAVRAAVCAAVSEETRESVVRYYHATNVIAVPNAIDTSKFVPGSRLESRRRLGLPESGSILLFASRLGSQKAESLIYGIAGMIKEGLPDVSVVGAAFGQKFRSDSGITGLDDFTYDKLIDAYRSADVFLLPSRHEGSSLALLEAMACGIPFLASPVGLVPELRLTGIFDQCIVDEQDPGSYVEKLKKLLLLSPEEKERLSESVRSYAVAEHSLEVFWNNYIKIIENIQNHD